MEVVILETPTAIGELAGNAIATVAASKPKVTLGLATGSSPLPTYEAITQLSQTGMLSLTGAKAFLLDEYIGLPADHDQSYAHFINQHFTQRTDIDTNNVHGPNTQAPDLISECASYEQLISQAGGIDIQLLGIGTDGHVGFNEPSSSLASRTRPKTLTNQTRLDNARFFATIDDVPHHVITQGLGTILEARHLILIATGAGKAEAIAAAVEGPITAMCPGSMLQLHPHATVLLDPASAALLTHREYYQHCWANKPSWQGL